MHQGRQRASCPSIPSKKRPLDISIKTQETYTRYILILIQLEKKAEENLDGISLNKMFLL